MVTESVNFKGHLPIHPPLYRGGNPQIMNRYEPVFKDELGLQFH